ncbi:MAG: tyrosine-type recombinase/integrase [Chloroflexi bacterium]|nr:tyrosine-type recombinase/integrase [Chloroflexota bacterium]
MYENNGLVFTSPTGGILDPGTLSKSWQRLCKREGMKFRLHDLRHHHATALIENGVHIKAVQNRLGHSSPSLTMKIYAHVSPQTDKEAAEAYDRAMAAARLK